MSQPQTSSGASATVAFIDLAGFSAIADVYGDASAIAVLEIFESMVREALSGYEPPIKWIGDEAMLSFPEPEMAIQALGILLQACRKEPRLPLTRAGVNHGPVIRRAGDLFGSTVNIAARIASLAAPGQFLATQPIAEAAAAKGIQVRGLGKVALRSVAAKSLSSRSSFRRHLTLPGSIPCARCMLLMNPIGGLPRKGRGSVRRDARKHTESRRRPIRCSDNGQRNEIRQQHRHKTPGRREVCNSSGSSTRDSLLRNLL